ncbi:N-acetylmuramoyl-L-alanine amidase [Deinococcus radiophilus]|uniref:N-acetylmuramoyl-L-alanine amidase n=1 Tax=Deinococcus radiophilus TaxID=32062 RepID=A0A431VTC4_9DEIO|nr:N-acetylmuramoyl-L-alanine amidase [Deinococcus radiophilus]
MGGQTLVKRSARAAWLWCGLALSSAALAAAPTPFPAAPQAVAVVSPVSLTVELRPVAGHTRVFVTLPAGTPAFVPGLSRATGQAVISLPFDLLPVEGNLVPGGGSNALSYGAVGRQLTLGLGAGYGRVEAQFWPAVGDWPPGVVVDLWPAEKPAAAVRPAPVVVPVPTATPVVAAPASAPPAPVRPAGPVRATVVLDPGHGGNDPGMTSPWVREADINLDVALRTARLLQSHGVAVRLTRQADAHLHPDKAADLNLRARMATTGQVSAFVSIHVNAATDPAAHGIETYYFGQPLPGQGRSLAVRENGGGSLGESLTRQAAGAAQGVLGDLLSQAKLSFSRRLAGLVQAELVAATGARDRGVKTDAFYVIRTPTTPAILTELGFGSSPAEGARLADAAYRQRQAEALSRALLRFLNAG